MNWFRADLHIHSVLSPCGDLDMSPARIIEEAVNKKIDIVGISDHNSTKHAAITLEIGKKHGIVVIPGVEVNSSEEIHCLALFENLTKAQAFQDYLDDHLPHIQNKPSSFGHQLIVNENEEILDEEERLLISALTVDIEAIEKKVHDLDGLFIPAHIDRPYNSIYAHLGMIPDGLQADAFEVSRNSSPEEMTLLHPELSNYSLITNSDAHYPDHLGASTTEYYLEEASFIELKKALQGEGERKIRVA